MKKTNQNTTTTNTAAPTAAEETKALNLTDVENAPEDIVVEIFADKVITPAEFTAWVEDNFTEYSANLFKKTIDE